MLALFISAASLASMADEPGRASLAASTGDPARDALIGALVLELELTASLVRAQVAAVEIGRLNERMTKIETMLAVLVHTPIPTAIAASPTPTRTATVQFVPTATKIPSMTPVRTVAPPPWPTPRP